MLSTQAPRVSTCCLRLQPFTSCTETASKRTLAWVKTLVIGKNLCPFAAAPLNAGSLRIKVSAAETDSSALDEIESEIDLLFPAATLSTLPTQSTSSSSTNTTTTTTPTTTLIVFPNHKKLVESHPHQVKLGYDILVRISQNNNNKSSSSLQIVNFHPRGQHSLYAPPDEISLETDDPYNFVTRSPYPTVHLLRTVDLVDASKFMSNDTEKIPLRNMERLRKDGRDQLLQEWNEISQQQDKNKIT